MNRATPSDFQMSGLQDRADPAAMREDGLRDFLGVLSQYRLLIISLAVLGATAGVLYAADQTPTYSASSAIILTPGQPAISKSVTVSDTSEPNTGTIESEIEVLRSSGLAERLVDKVGVEKAGAWVARPVGPVRKALGLSSGGGKPRDEIVRELRKSFSVIRKETSFIVEITAVSATPGASAEMANALAQTYLDWKADDRARQLGASTEFIQTRLNTLKAEVETKAQAVANYRAGVGMLDLNGNHATDTQLASVQATLLQARADYAEKNARLEQLNRLRISGGSIETVYSVLNSQVITELRKKEAEIASSQAELSQRLGDKHPQLKQVERQREDIKSQIEVEVKRILANLSNEVEVAYIRVNELEKAQKALEGRVVSSNRNEVQLRELERQAEAATTLYQDYLTRSHETSEVDTLKVTDARMLSVAAADMQPSSPDPKLWVAFFAAVGLVSGLALALLRAALSDKLYKPEDVYKKIGRPALVSIPLVRKLELAFLPSKQRNPAGLIVQKPISRLAECIRTLLSQIMSRQVVSTGAVIAVTSAVASEGKTTTSLSLGRIAAMGGLKVLMIEGDLRMRSMSRIAGLADEGGFVDAMREGADWRTALVKDKLTDAWFLPAGGDGPAISDPFSAGKMKVILNEIRKEFDLIIFDCPPVLAVAESRTLTALADGVVIVTRWNQTPAGAIRTAIREIENAGGIVNGVAINCIKPSAVRRLSHGDSMYLGGAGSRYYAS